MEEQMEYERRSNPRTSIFRVARIVFGAHKCTLINCVVLNLTAAGACARVEDDGAVPDEFELTFDGLRTLRPCRVAWRMDGKLGVEFSKHALSLEPVAQRKEK